MILSAALPMPAFRANARALVKAVSWRVIGALDTMAIALYVTGSLAAASSIMSIEVFTKIFLYAMHERAWDKFWRAA